ncbi:1-phosphofructokinase family hexose kinase [Oceanobacillus caeni]|uniref:1-phosphofructokinase family hexose kinase n=1 Tax=Oceanobacillus caeni TaxID=405946 RepID=UPI001C2149A9|nr:PfkB family carbohydrate kinase [Oceanobacillus caeni]MBU8790008.1 hypothetical protein [Oceanobacillus caeni]
MIHLICPNPAIDRTLLIKNFSSAIPNRPYEVKEFPGGKSFNVAYALKRENPNAKVAIHTIIGGHNGEYLKQLAKEKQYQIIDTAVKQNTRLCNILVDTEKSTIYPIYEKGLQLSDEILKDFSSQIVSTVQDNDTLVFSGSLMKGMPDDYIVQITQKIDKENVKVFVDTSGRSLVETYKSNPYVIKINDEEIMDLFPNETLSTKEDYIQLLRKIDHIPYFIVTLGAKGVIAKMEDQLLFAKANEIKAKNPIASGDFFLGVLTHCIESNLNHEETLKLAIAYSTANCLNWYPEVNQEDVNKVYNTVRLEKL